MQQVYLNARLYEFQISLNGQWTLVPLTTFFLVSICLTKHCQLSLLIQRDYIYLMLSYSSITRRFSLYISPKVLYQMCFMFLNFVKSLSTLKLTKELQCFAFFFTDFFLLKYFFTGSGKEIGEEVDGLYILLISIPMMIKVYHYHLSPYYLLELEIWR